MKKILLFFVAIIWISFINSNVNAYTCNQVFEWTKLRYNANYKFYDTFNAWSRNAYMNNYKVHFVNPSYLDKWSSYGWTQTLKNAWYKVSAYSSMRILETWATNRRIAKHPTTRTNATKSSYDFMIAYEIIYDYSNNYPDSSDDITHTECKYYSVTWCWDGVRDAWDEVCDYNDPNHVGWWNGWCDQSCQPINVTPPATCDGITATPNSWTATVNSTITCSATNANSYQIRCGNGQVINSKTWTCTYTLWGNYTASCTINWNITSNQCKTQISVTAPTPLIEVEKYSGNNSDLDWNRSHIPSDDSQTINLGAEAVFIIRVTNNWREDLKTVTLSDAIAPNCNRSDSETQNLIRWVWNHDSILNVWESFTYTCNKTNTTQEYENRINVAWVWVTSNLRVTDTDETQVRLVQPSILVIKLDANSNDFDWVVWNDTQTVSSWSTAIFGITVRNNWTEDLKTVTLSDTIAPNCNRNDSETQNLIRWVWNHDSILNVWESFTYTCNRDNTQSNYTNTIIVNAVWVNSNQQVNDDDITQVIVWTDSSASCTNLTVTPDNWVVTFSSSFTCTAVWANSYRIEVKNSSWTLLNTINSNTWNYSFTQIGTYNISCYINNENTTNDSCVKTIIATENNGWNPYCWDGNIDPGEQCDDWNNISWDGCSATCSTEWWGGWRAATCYDIETTGTQVTCYWNDMTETFRVDCGNGINKFVSATNADATWRTKGTVTCDYSVEPKVSEPRCFVSGLWINVIPNPKENYWGWTTRNQCQATVGQYCWNGILEWNEECEKDNYWVFPDICNTNCTLKDWGWVTTDPGQDPWVITIPTHWNIIFGEKANVIIYQWQSVADKVSTPYIYNDSDYDLNLKALCVVQTSWNTLTIPAIQPNCKALPGILYPGQRIEFPGAYNEYKGKEITSWNYGDNILKITYQKLDGTILDWAYFAETVKVRVAKPSIVTTGWGTSYVRSVNKVSDINKVANWVVDPTKVDDNKNFVWTSVSDLTSYSDNTTNTTIVDKVENTWDDYNSNVWDAVDNTAPATTEIKTSLSDFESYNWMKDVFVLKSKNFKINSDLFSSISGPRTYIIENGDLYINKDIVYNDNIAFVVKWGDIFIDSSVKRIDWTYITLKQWTNWWNIKSAQSTDTLVVNWSLYWNIDDLVSNRVKVEENNWNLSVWTVVSFGSSLFRKPAPLVSQFIAEYLEQQKVAQ